jgi:hypothetical protein
MSLLVALGCSNGGVNPLTPTDNGLTANSAVKQSQTHLWGMYDVYIDIPTQTATAVLNRSAMFTANVTTFVNKPATNLGFLINSTPIGADFIDVDINVTIKHPFPGMHMYDGYDVRGVFMADGSQNMVYGSGLKVGALGTDQVMLANPLTPFNGAPDGYTRWFNPSEFTFAGLVGYTRGTFATPNYNASATLCPYKYFADGLSANGDVWDFLTTTSGSGVFTAGASNVRNYYLRFPNAKGVKYSYAIIASWIDETTHPANAPEAMAISTQVTPDVYFVDGTDKGGKLKLGISVKDWDSALSAGEDYTIFVQSNVLSAVHEFDASEMTPTGGDDNFSTYYAEIPADAVSGTAGNYFWVICEENGADYTGPFTPTGGAPAQPLASFFRYDLFVANVPYNKAPVCDVDVVTAMPVSGWVPVPVVFDASGSTDPDAGDTLSYAWDFDGDGVYDETPDDDHTGTDANPTHVYTATYTGVVNVKVSDQLDAESICTTPNLNVTIKTSCGTMTAITGNSQTFIGSARLYAYPPVGTRAASPARVIGSPNGAAYYVAAIDPDSTAMPFQATNNPTYSWYNMAVASNDRIFFNDSGSANTIYYMDYSNSTGFTNIRTASSFGTIPAGTIHKLVLDNNDYPVVLTQQWNIYHWNGSTWGSAITVPSAVQTAAGSYANLNDMDYDPTTGYFILVERNGVPGVYAVKPDGTVAWSDTDIWAGQASGWDAGVEIYKTNAECRIVLGAGIGGSGSASVPFYFARINPMGGEKVTSSITNAVPYGYTFAMFDGNGGLVKVGSAYRWYSATYGGNVWGYATMPSGF